MTEAFHATRTLQKELAMMGDEWKGGGYCPECRRRDYCKSECKAGRAWKLLHLQRSLYWDKIILGKGNANGKGHGHNSLRMEG